MSILITGAALRILKKYIAKETGELKWHTRKVVMEELEEQKRQDIEISSKRADVNLPYQQTH